MPILKQIKINSHKLILFYFKNINFHNLTYIFYLIFLYVSITSVCLYIKRYIYNYILYNYRYIILLKFLYVSIV